LAPQNDLRDDVVCGVAVHSSHLTDDELLLAIASNTNSFSALIEKQFELDAGVGAPDPNTRRNLLRFNVQTINNYHREYREYIAELRRRYLTI
jgi:hypothetical protein